MRYGTGFPNAFRSTTSIRSGLPGRARLSGREVSRRIREEFENGRHYYELQGQRLAVIPRKEADRPAPEFLRWHNGVLRDGRQPMAEQFAQCRDSPSS